VVSGRALPEPRELRRRLKRHSVLATVLATLVVRRR
jgi:hypothetical protein